MLVIIWIVLKGCNSLFKASLAIWVCPVTLSPWLAALEWHIPIVGAWAGSPQYVLHPYNGSPGQSTDQPGPGGKWRRVGATSVHFQGEQIYLVQWPGVLICIILCGPRDSIWGITKKITTLYCLAAAKGCSLRLQQWGRSGLGPSAQFCVFLVGKIFWRK